MVWRHNETTRTDIAAAGGTHGTVLRLWGHNETTGTDIAAAGESRGARGAAPLSVSQAVGAAKARVGEMPALHVTGEVTGFRGPNARSGHCYFQVKDATAAMDVIVWRGTYKTSGVELRDGMQLELVGKFDVYAGSGRLSFIAKSLAVAGEGLLRQQVAELARKLEAEGLMAPEHKRPIPRFCSRVAVVTSLSGSVIDDVRRTLRRRNSLVELQMVGCQVQGPGAAETIKRALGVAADAHPDAILLVRGGGSFEDLMTFNDEGLARVVAASPVPVITGIGHEPDTCICDMVADRRTSTPTAAAESVAPALDEIVASIDDRRVRLGRAMGSRLSSERQQIGKLGALADSSARTRIAAERQWVDSLARHRCLIDPSSIVDERVAALMQAEQRLVDAIPRSLARALEQLESMSGRLASCATRVIRPHEALVASLAATLDALSPLKVLGRGYAIVRTTEGHVVCRASELASGDTVSVLVGTGSFDAQVEAVHEDPALDVAAASRSSAS